MAPTPKQGTGPRNRPPSSLSQVSTPPASSSRSKKATKPSLTVILKAPSDFLAKISEDGSAKKPDTKRGSRAQTTTASTPSGTANAESEASGEVQGDAEANVVDGAKDAGEGAAVAGTKREAEDGDSKPKQPQRKRPRVGENGRMDGRTAAAKAAGYNAAAHKLGPKANTGVINEKLRALDRTKRPARRWAKTGFTIKSFTGRVWHLPSWKTPDNRNFGEDAESRDTSSLDLSKAGSSSNVGSDHSPGGENLPGSSPVRIAPAPVK